MDKVLQIDRVSQMKEIQSKALELFARKNADYGDAFAKYGVIGVLMRIEDKIQRGKTSWFPYHPIPLVFVVLFFKKNVHYLLQKMV